MFKGIYHGKQAHPPDLPAVLARAWEAGVERIIVRHQSLMTLATHFVTTRNDIIEIHTRNCVGAVITCTPWLVNPMTWFYFRTPPLQVTGGSLAESREALALAETDGKRQLSRPQTVRLHLRSQLSRTRPAPFFQPACFARLESIPPDAR